jgi:hypothetical protein
MPASWTFQCLDQTRLDLGQADAADDVEEEALDDQAAGLLLGDATAAQIEQLVRVEAPVELEWPAPRISPSRSPGSGPSRPGNPR